MPLIIWFPIESSHFNPLRPIIIIIRILVHYIFFSFFVIFILVYFLFTSTGSLLVDFLLLFYVSLEVFHRMYLVDARI